MLNVNNTREHAESYQRQWSNEKGVDLTTLSWSFNIFWEIVVKIPILSGFEWINELVFPLKSSANHWFFDDVRGSRSQSNQSNSLSIRNRIWWRAPILNTFSSFIWCFYVNSFATNSKYIHFLGLHKTFWGTTQKCENKNLS